uniref:Peptidyl-prolyl cis-trans isomerase n=1 Tax=Magnetococcus massalia (strain MO-1) TaxID=451514 RepID=A0A1S7LKA6_MAGMO|nr:Peptidyl-prolyl cis-trans isomerase A [Candidatus Magnetococcus massalia]
MLNRLFQACFALWLPVVMFLTLPGVAEAGMQQKGANPMVIISTNLGDIKLSLNEEKAPISVANFLSYVDKGHYDGTIFHRVIPNFMVQGGGMDENMKEKSTDAPIKNEADNGLKNTRGSIAMARTQVVDSATSQFFININDNDFLNHGGRDFGYAVFGEVAEGMDVIEKIVAVPTGNRGFHQDVPTEPVIIQSIKRAE